MRRGRRGAHFDPRDAEALVAAVRRHDRATARALLGRHPELLESVFALSLVPLLEEMESDDPEAVATAADLLDYVTRLTTPDAEFRYLYATLHATVLRRRFALEHDPADLSTAAAALRFAISVAQTPEERANCLLELATILYLTRDEHSPRAIIDEEVACLREAVSLTRPGAPELNRRLMRLGAGLATRFERLGALADLDEALDAARQAAATASAGEDRFTTFSFLGELLKLRGDLRDSAQDTGEAIEVLRALNAAARDAAQSAQAATALANALRARGLRGSGTADFDEAIGLLGRALELTPQHDSGRLALLDALAATLRARGVRTRTTPDLRQALTLQREVLAVLSDGDPDRVTAAHAMANTAMELYRQHSGEAALLDEAVEVLRWVVERTAETSHERPLRLHELGVALRNRFERDGQAGDLDEAVAYCRAAVDAASAGHVDRATVLAGLELALRARFHLRSERADLDEAIACNRTALKLATSHLYLSIDILVNLGNALRTRYEQSGSQQDLDEAVACHRAATAHAQTHHPPLQAACLVNLANTLMHRYSRHEALPDLEEAVGAARAALDGTDPQDPGRLPMIATLSTLLWMRAERLRTAQDLDDAVRFARQAVTATPVGDAQYPARLFAFASAVRGTSAIPGDPQVAREAINLLRHALDVLPASRPSHPLLLGQLAQLLADDALAEDAIDPTRLNESIAAARQSVLAMPTESPNRAAALSALGRLLATRAELGGTHAQRGRDVAEAAQALSESSHVAGAPALIRVLGAQAAAELLAETEPSRAADLARRAVLLLPELAPRSLRRAERQHGLGRVADVAANAAALALDDPAIAPASRPVRALALLEAGRAILMSQALDTRGDLTDLRRAHPQLAERFQALRDNLDRDSNSEPAQPAMFASDPAEHRRTLARELAATLTRIRELDGFAAFGLPPAREQLLAEAADGPIVVFNIAARRSDALLITEAGIRVLPLPDATPAKLYRHSGDFLLALADTQDSDEIPQRLAARDSMFQTLAWLWDAVAGPVLDELGYREGPEPGAPWPRVWWCPAGPMSSMLPLHAAGHHDDPATPRRRAVLDRVVSSYTPTIRALTYARERMRIARLGAPESRSLIVSMPTTPGTGDAGRLHHVAEEARLLHGILPRPTLLAESEKRGFPRRDAPPIPNRKRVLAELAGCTIAHFACHGYTDAADPSLSHLALHDHRSNPLTAAALATADLERAQLAYLSACHTATNASFALRDEAISLASAFHLAGFPHVVGTLWSIDDDAAVELARTFYNELRDPRTGVLDTNRSAIALHTAVREQRDAYPKTPTLWAAHIHSGT